MGVELFFVLSGFLITHIVLKAWSERKGLLTFYIHRFGRIMPVYMLLLFIVIFASTISSHPKIEEISTATRDNFIWYFTFASNLAGFFGVNLGESNKALGVVWSLALEQQYYLLWPPIVYYLGARKSLKFALALIGISFLLRLALYNRMNSEILYTFPLFHFDGLLIGSSAAIISAQFDIKRAWLFSFVVASLASVVALIWLAGGTSYKLPIIQIFGFTLIPLFYISVLLTACANCVNAYPLRNSLLRKYGKYSYCMYLFHPLFLLIVSQLHLTSGIASFLCFYLAFSTFMLVFAAIIWKVFEKPINNIFRRLAARHDSGIQVFSKEFAYPNQNLTK